MDFMDMLEEMLAPENVKTNPKRWIPKVGDKVTLTDDFYETIGDGVECAKLARLPFCTVDSVAKICLGDDDDYEWYYEIYVKETRYLVGINYEKYKDAKEI